MLPWPECLDATPRRDMPKSVTDAMLLNCNDLRNYEENSRLACAVL
jgi:hypothetical protein